MARELTTLSAVSERGVRRHVRATMRDVAALAGVSIKTVSRVVNDEPGVSADLVRRVETAADQLGYQPDVIASNLRRGTRRTGTLGLMLENVANPFSGAIHRAIDDAARERGVAVLATSLDQDPQREHEVARTMIRRRVDGLVVMPTGADQAYLGPEMQAGLATVFVDRPPRFLDADTVLATNRAGAQEAVEHLIAAGHRRVGFLGDLADISTAAERYEGYAEALRDAGIALDERIVRRGLRTRESAERAAEELLRLPEGVAPGALFASQNLITIGTVHALHRHDLQHLVALVGFDDVELAEMLDPGVTVVVQDPYAMGRTAAELLFARLDGYRGPSQHRTIATRLVARGSGEIRPRAGEA
jgi:LacI family transcriptional regulator